MTLPITLLVLFAAALHAVWNAMLRGGSDRLWSMTVMCIAIALACAGVACFVPVPTSASWAYAVLSAFLHVGYNLFLVRTYREGDLGQTYPIARGSSPILVAAGAALFAGELPSVISCIGIVLVCGGIIFLATQGRRLSWGTLPYALGTGCFIGAYSVTDGIGGRLSGSPVGYTVWMCLLWGLLMPGVYTLLRDWRTLRRGPRETVVAAVGGLVSLMAYGIVIYAMAMGAMGAVSALRETSVVFAALIGALFLKEKLTPSRLLACSVIALGTFLIAQER